MIIISVKGFWKPIVCMVGAKSRNRECENHNSSSHVKSIVSLLRVIEADGILGLTSMVS